MVGGTGIPSRTSFRTRPEIVRVGVIATHLPKDCRTLVKIVRVVMLSCVPNCSTYRPHEREESGRLGSVCGICDLPHHALDDSDVPVK